MVLSGRRDWCGEAIAAVGINSSDYNHVMCMALYSQSNTICDACDATKSSCAGTCPANGGITAISVRSVHDLLLGGGGC